VIQERLFRVLEKSLLQMRDIQELRAERMEIQKR